MGTIRSSRAEPSSNDSWSARNASWLSEDDNRLLGSSNAMAIVALERQTFHDKIVRLRALRDAAEATKAPTKTTGRPARRWIPAD
jgi:hypothetical protein